MSVFDLIEKLVTARNFTLSVFVLKKKKMRERERSSNLLILQLSLVKIRIGVNKKLPKDKKENSGIQMSIESFEKL